MGVQEGGEESFEPGGVGRGFARVDVFVEGVDLGGLVQLVVRDRIVGGLFETYVEILDWYQVLWLVGVSERRRDMHCRRNILRRVKIVIGVDGLRCCG